MPITVKYSPSAAAIGESAYTIGRGEKGRWAAEFGLKQQALSLQAASIGASASARAGQLGLGYAQLGSRTEQQRAELEFRKQQWQDEPARQLEKGLQQQKILREQERYEYTESQKRRRAQVMEGLNWLQQRDDWTPEQKEDAARQLMGIYHKIIPGPVDVGPTLQQQHDSQYVIDQETGARYWMKPNGERELEGQSPEDFSKQYNLAWKNLAAVLFRVPTEEEIREHIVKENALRAEIQGLAKETKEKRIRLQQKAVQDLQAIEEREEEEQELRKLQGMQGLQGPLKSKGLKAKFAGPGEAAQETPEGLGDIPQPKTKAEYDKLKPGTRYIDPDGVERIKR